MWQCALQSVSQEMDSVWLPTIVAVIQDGLAVSVKRAYQLMDAVSHFLYPHASEGLYHRRRNRGGRGCLSPPTFQSGGA